MRHLAMVTAVAALTTLLRLPASAAEVSLPLSEVKSHYSKLSNVTMEKGVLQFAAPNAHVTPAGVNQHLFGKLATAPELTTGFLYEKGFVGETADPKKIADAKGSVALSSRDFYDLVST